MIEGEPWRTSLSSRLQTLKALFDAWARDQTSFLKDTQAGLQKKSHLLPPLLQSRLFTWVILSVAHFMTLLTDQALPVLLLPHFGDEAITEQTCSVRPFQ